MKGRLGRRPGEELVGAGPHRLQDEIRRAVGGDGEHSGRILGAPDIRARAVENGVHLAAAGYDYASEVVDPLGMVLALVAPSGGPGAAVADIDLTSHHREDWLGDWHDISNKERTTMPYRYQLP